MKNDFLIRAMATVAIVLVIAAVVIALLIPAKAIEEPTPLSMRTEGLVTNRPHLIAEEAVNSGEYAPKPTYSEDDLRMLSATMIPGHDLWRNHPAGAVRRRPYAYTVLDMTDETVRRCYANAKAALEGKVDCPSDVVFQAEFMQGREVYEIIEVDTGWYRSTTYFCQG